MDRKVASVTLHEAIYGLERLPEGKRKRMLGDYVREVVTTTARLTVAVENRFDVSDRRTSSPDHS